MKEKEKKKSKRKKPVQKEVFEEEEYEEEVEEEETLVHYDLKEEQNEVKDKKRIKRTIETSIDIKYRKGKHKVKLSESIYKANALDQGEIIEKPDG